MKRKLTDWLLTVFICLLFMLLAVLSDDRGKVQLPEPDLRVEQLQAEVTQLRADMEDVKNVQGYMAWEKDWRNNKGGIQK
jgi:hypothetical protein